MNGIDECRANLLKLKLGKAAANFFEGMACEGGCLNGALCLHHGPKNVLDVDKYGQRPRKRRWKIRSSSSTSTTTEPVFLSGPPAGGPFLLPGGRKKME